MREKEKIFASKITDDHILADSMKKSLSALFPNVLGLKRFIIFFLYRFKFLL